MRAEILFLSSRTPTCAREKNLLANQM